MRRRGEDSTSEEGASQQIFVPRPLSPIEISIEERTPLVDPMPPVVEPYSRPARVGSPPPQPEKEPPVLLVTDGESKKAMGGARKRTKSEDDDFEKEDESHKTETPDGDYKGGSILKDIEEEEESWNKRAEDELPASEDEEELMAELHRVSPHFWESRCGKVLSGCASLGDAVLGRWIPKGGIFASIFELLSATLGAGTLSLPFAFRVSGVGLAGILMLIGALAAYYSIHLLVLCSDITRKRSYEEMTRVVFGRKVEILLDISIIIFAWGSTVGYLVAIGDIVPQVLEMLHITDVVHAMLVERWVIMTAVTVFVIFPLSLLKKLSSLRFTATLGFFATCYLVFVVFGRTTESIVKDGLDPKGELQFFDWGSGFFIAAPIIFYAYSSHVNIFSIYSELSYPTPRRIKTVIFGDVFLAFLVYASIGLFGYLHFFSDTDANILNNYSSNDIPVQLGAIALVWSIIFNIPLNNHPCRITVDYMIFGPSSTVSHTLRHWGETFVIVFLALIISITVPDITTIFSLLGATATAFCCYIMPAILYLKVGDFKLWSWEALPCILLVLASSCSSITSTVIIIMDLVS